MSDFRVCKVGDVARGAVKQFVVDSDELKRTSGEVAVVRTDDDQWFALEDRCSHGRFRMSEGFVDGCAIECSRHGSMFDLSTGNALNPPASTAIRIFEVRIDGEDVVMSI